MGWLGFPKSDGIATTYGIIQQNQKTSPVGHLNLTKGIIASYFRYMKTPILSLLVAVGLIGSAYADQPNMQNALTHLREAKIALQAANNNKGGWRVAAIASIDKAIIQIEKGIRFAR